MTGPTRLPTIGVQQPGTYCVDVALMECDGDCAAVCVWAPTVAAAVTIAEDTANEQRVLGSDDWVMNDWRPA